MMCRHCQKKKSNRPRGLCWHCYHVPGLRDLYPSLSKFAQWANGPPARLPADVPAFIPPAATQLAGLMKHLPGLLWVMVENHFRDAPRKPTRAEYDEIAGLRGRGGGQLQAILDGEID